MFGLDDFFSGGASAIANFFGGREANESNRASTREQMAFQERMSSTAYQRARKDMEAAGINPILGYSQGGASSPVGSSYVSQNVVSGAVSSAMDAIRMRAELRNLAETNSKIKSDTLLNKALTQVAVNDAKIKSSTAKLVSLQIPGAQVESNIDSSLFGKVMRYVGRFLPFASSATGVARALQKKGTVINKNFY